MPVIGWQVRLAIYGICFLAIVLAIHHVYAMGYDSAKDDDAKIVAKANQQFLDAQKLKQEASDRKAAAETAAANKQFDDIMKKLNGLRGPAPVGKPTTKLAADCVFDDARVKWANEP